MAPTEEVEASAPRKAIDARNVPVSTFRASHVEQTGGLYPAREATRRLGSSMRDLVVADTPLAEVKGIVLHAYMMRRFGPPGLPGDPRMITATWLLDTPDPGVFVEVAPRLGAGVRNFSPRLLSDAETVSIDDARAAEVAAAYRATLVDLLRPVRVGEDDWLNAFGECDPDDPSLGGDDQGEEPNALALDPDGSCGNATPFGTCATPRWEEFWTAVRNLGKGDWLAGQDKVVSMARGQAIGAIPHADEAVRVLVLAHIRGGYAATVIRMADPADMLKAEAASVRLALEQAWRRGAHLPMRAFTDGQVRQAEDFLAVMDSRTPIMNAVERHRGQEARNAFVARFLALGDLPDEVVPDEMPGSNEVHGLADRLLALGRTEQADMVRASLLADPYSGEVYDLLVHGLRSAMAARRDAQSGPGGAP